MNQDPLLPANLHYFHAAAKDGSFHGAARTCVVSQPTISKAVRALEIEVGVALFDRIKHRVYLTAAGAMLAQLCATLEARVAEFRTELERDAGGPPRGVIRLAALRTMGTGIVPELASDVASVYPGINLSLSFAAPAEIAEFLRQGHIDVGIVPGPNSPELQRVRLGRDEAALVVSRQSVIPDRVSAEILNKLPLILASRTNPWWTEHLAPFFSGIDITPHVVMEVDQGEATMALVEKDLGASILPGHLVAGALSQGRLRQVAVEGGLFWQDLEVVSLSGRTLSPAMRAVIERISFVAANWVGQ